MTSPSPEPNPFDELNVQLPGRLYAVEILLTLLLRDKANSRKLLLEADAHLNRMEEVLHAEGIGSENDYALKIFAVARTSLDTISRNILTSRGN